MEQTHSSPTAKVRIAAYKETIEKYLPAVIIKCTKYTNSKHLAEIIAIFTFICVYRLTESLDGYRIPVLIDSMVNIVGGDFADGSGKPIVDKLFDDGRTLQTAKAIDELDIEECMSHVDFAGDVFGQNQLERITESIMRYVIKRY